jgi:uncharacterized protein YkwD
VGGCWRAACFSDAVSKRWRVGIGLLLLATAAGCGVAEREPIGAQAASSAVPSPTPYPIQPTYTPLPTSTPYPLQPTYTPLATIPPPATMQTLATTPPPTTIASLDRFSEDDLGAQMLAALNQRRSEHGCPPLTIDRRLQAAAQAHAADIAARRAIDHVGGDGATLEQRLERAGYPFIRRSETISVARDWTPVQVVDTWLAEPPDGPHRASILNCVYQHVGIGLARTPDGVIYWAVDYAEPRNE